MTMQDYRHTGRNMIKVCSRARAISIVAMLAVSAQAWAQKPLPDLSIEDLMKLDAGQVFGASERLQPVTEAPASVSFITAEEIARYGYRTLADILRGVRGMYVTDDRNFSLIGTRGFAKPGDYNSRILLLVNGHRVNDNVFGQAEIGAEFGLDPAIFERVEIIRGPASSLYGDSAFFAVVNVITRSGASLGGASIALETGTPGTRLARATVGHRLENGVDVALSGTYEQSAGVGRLYFPAFDTPATNHGVSEGLDRLITAIADDSTLLGVSYVNQGEVRAKGLELEAQMRLKGSSQALVSYALQSAVDQQTHGELPNSPRHVVKARISLPGPTHRSFVSVDARYLSSRETTSGSRVSAASAINVTVVQPIGRSWELLGAVRNVFDAQYEDPVSNQHRQDAIPQNGRTARIGLRWGLCTK
jgi:outer membrane receptor for ferrienterochelin and colicin